MCNINYSSDGILKMFIIEVINIGGLTIFIVTNAHFSKRDIYCSYHNLVMLFITKFEL